jgi:hypothetical protein
MGNMEENNLSILLVYPKKSALCIIANTLNQAIFTN